MEPGSDNTLEVGNAAENSVSEDVEAGLPTGGPRMRRGLAPVTTVRSTSKKTVESYVEEE